MNIFLMGSDFFLDVVLDGFHVMVDDGLDLFDSFGWIIIELFPQVRE